jgi:hypothetical protein
MEMDPFPGKLQSSPYSEKQAFPSLATKIHDEFGSESEEVELLLSHAVQIKSAREIMIILFIFIVCSFMLIT